MKIKLKVERIEDKAVILKTEDDVSIVWPKNKLPDELEPGTDVYVEISLSENKDETAKKILNELLNINE
jgi:hypothetical protein